MAVAAGHAGTHLKSAPGNGCIQWVHCGSRRFSRMGVVGPNKRLEAFGLQSLQGMKMQVQSNVQQQRARFQVCTLRRPAKLASWWILAAGLLGSISVWAQALAAPEQETPASPRTGGDQELSTPQGGTPAAPSDGSRPVPDRGVVAPPPVGGSTPVIRPPSMGTMPVIPPPGSPGGDKSIVPK